MKRLRRWLFNFAAAVSLVVSVTTMILAIRSYSVPQRLTLYTQENKDGYAAFGVDWFRGSIYATKWHGRGGSRPIGTFALRLEDFDTALRIMVQQEITPADNYWIHADEWIVASGFAALPIVWVWKYLKRRPGRGIGYCSACGYDLRATPARCPECGAIPAAAKETAT